MLLLAGILLKLSHLVDGNKGFLQQVMFCSILVPESHQLFGYISVTWWGNIASVNTQSAPESSQSSEAFPKGRELDKSQGSEVSMITEKDSKFISQMGHVLKDEKALSDSEGISMLAGNMGLHDEDLMHVSILSRTRKKSADKGRKALKLAVTRGYSVCKLGDKDKSLLEQIFGFPLQSLWKASLSRTESVL
eukprot:Gb_00224 [translate_table: standard]